MRSFFFLQRRMLTVYRTVCACFLLGGPLIIDRKIEL